MFPSAISRYLVSNVKIEKIKGEVVPGFHPLYRGTWFPTFPRKDWSSSLQVSIRYIAVLGFQRPPGPCWMPAASRFPSAISRYLVSNKMMHTSTSMVRIGCFHPLYRGTWFPTRRNKPAPDCHFTVSIRYIAVLGFQRPCSWCSGSCGNHVSIRYIAVLGFQLKHSN